MQLAGVEWGTRGWRVRGKEVAKCRICVWGGGTQGETGLHRASQDRHVPGVRDRKLWRAEMRTAHTSRELAGHSLQDSRDAAGAPHIP